MPTVAICICTAGRPSSLRALLRHLGSIDTKEIAFAELTLIVVDNRPERSVRSLVEQAARELPFTVLYAPESTPGIPFARNRAVAEALARGARFVSFIDDDDLPSPDWLDQLLRTQRSASADMVFGRIVHPPDIVVPGWLAGVGQYQPAVLDRMNIYGVPQAAGTNNVLLSRPMLVALSQPGPLFRPELARTGGEDTDLFIRAKRAGFTFAVADGSVVTAGWTPERLTALGMLRRAYNLGILRNTLARLHRPEQSRPRWRALRKLAKSLRALVGAPGGRGSFAARLVAVTEDAGEVAASLGAASSYYASEPTKPGPIGRP
jgi:succinoglycan biosynthesis protein ExoM